MAQDEQPPESSESSKGMQTSRTASGPRPMSVEDEAGQRRPFLRGILTHHLIQRGLDFDTAYALSHALKAEFADREVIEISELRDRVAQELETRLGPDALLTPGAPKLSVTYGGDAQPFSRGLLAQSLVATGLSYDGAYQHVLEIQNQLLHENVTRLDNRDLAHRVGEYLEEFESPAAARRYRLVRKIRALPKPLVVYIGGVSGTGKSTMALEVAPLLRIYRINSTDTIRQVMRMVFNQSMLPSLHRSTFEFARGSNQQDAISGLEEQATQVCVGVRAVVERAVSENLSIFVEGVHLIPPLVPFPDLDAVAYQLFVLMSTMDEEVHRSHMLARANDHTRPAARYLESLPIIRRQQEMLLERASKARLPIIDTSIREVSVRETARIIIDQLERHLPHQHDLIQAGPTLLLLVDGLPDRPSKALEDRTPLQAARTPVLDALAKSALCGLADPVGTGVVPDTAAGTLAAFGVSPYAMKRGPIEALGAGLELAPDDIALRANFASLDENGGILDRRAGRIREDAAELARALDGIVIELPLGEPVAVLVRAATEHRVAVVLRGPGLSPDIRGSDPGTASVRSGPLLPAALLATDLAAQRTAEALRLFEKRAREILGAHHVNARRVKAGLPPANALLTRGAGRIHVVSVPSHQNRPLSIACVSGDLTVMGVALALGGHTLSDPGIITANLDTDLGRKFELAAQALTDHDLVVVHFKGADIASHDRRVKAKVEFIEKLDEELGNFLARPDIEALRASGGLTIAVAADHATYSEDGSHGPDPVPVLIQSPLLGADGVQTFDEFSVREGSLGRFALQQLVPRILEGSLVRATVELEPRAGTLD